MATRKVLVVDDSLTYRRIVSTVLGKIPGYEVVGQAADGIEALAFLSSNQVDLVTCDLEMPRMDGKECIKGLRRAGCKARVLVFSALSRAGADASLEAMALGADDYVTKPDTTGTTISPQDAVRSALLAKLEQFWPPPRAAATVTPQSAVGAVAPRPIHTVPLWGRFAAQAVVIASSTGGPVALEKMLTAIKRKLLCPVFLVQHMPPVFTTSLAARLKTVCGQPVQEAVQGEVPKPGVFYLCPGDFHLKVERRDGGVKMVLDQAPQRNFVRPAADFLFESAAHVFGRKCLGLVLTGMGSDGRDGALALKKAGSAVVIQNEATCSVFGMPKAVQDVGAFDTSGTLEELGEIIAAAAG